MAGKIDPGGLFGHCASKERCKETIVVVLVSPYFFKVINERPRQACEVRQDLPLIEVINAVVWGSVLLAEALQVITKLPMSM